MGRAGHVARMGTKKNVYRVLIGKQDQKITLEIHRCEDNINMDFREIEWGEDWIHLAQDTDQCLMIVIPSFGFHKLLGIS
jgi:hypothetical protein